MVAASVSDVDLVDVVFRSGCHRTRRISLFKGQV